MYDRNYIYVLSFPRITAIELVMVIKTRNFNSSDIVTKKNSLPSQYHSFIGLVMML